MSQVLSPFGVENNDECRREREGGFPKGAGRHPLASTDCRQTDRLLADRRYHGLARLRMR